MSWLALESFTTAATRGGCLMCGNDVPRNLANGKEIILSTNYQSEFDGVAEFCQSCIEEGGQVVGMVSKRKYDKTALAGKRALERVKVLESELLDKTTTIQVLTKELQSTPASSAV